nr:MAG TPA: hypothetical protein [Caudoviricetes sp.]
MIIPVIDATSAQLMLPNVFAINPVSDVMPAPKYEYLLVVSVILKSAISAPKLNGVLRHADFFGVRFRQGHFCANGDDRFIH